MRVRPVKRRRKQRVASQEFHERSTVEIITGSSSTAFLSGSQRQAEFEKIIDTQPALVVHLVPVQRSAQDVFIGASHIVLVTPVTAPAAPLTNLLVGLFDLTPAEAAVARGIASGDSIPDFARRNGVSPETVRTQLRAVFEKTGTRRQADLVRLLSGAAPLGKIIT